MEKLINYLRIFYILPLILAVSCRPNPPTTGSQLEFDTLRVNTTHYINDNKSMPACNLNIRFVYPVSGTTPEDLKPLQSLFIEKILHEQFSQLTPKEAIDAYRLQYLSEFKQLDPQETSELEVDEKNGFTYYMDISNRIVYNRNNFISIEVERENYEGGAHGSKSIHGYVVDLNSGELLNEDSFAGTNYNKNVSELMLRILARNNNLSDPEELLNIGYTNVSDLVPNGNFTLNEKGITYYFNELEIGGYFLGVTSLFIPYEELTIYIQKESPISEITGK